MAHGNSRLNVRPTAVYLVVDTDGHPLYVGISKQPKIRCSGHLKRKSDAADYFILQWVGVNSKMIGSSTLEP